jgi:lysophospholipase L1-like esterase
MQLKDRRGFLQQALGLGATGIIAPQLLAGRAEEQDGKNFTFLFQGDSITDGNRTRNNDWNHVMGHGYQYIIASKLWYDYPKRGLHFFNRGISGNRVTDLADRWQKDTLALGPDLLSILIGINDTSAFIAGNKEYSAANFESSYRALLQQTRQQLPSVQLVLCEPFILPVGRVKEQWQVYSEEIGQRQQVVKKLSLENDATFVAFQGAFNKALSKAPAEYWVWDGIHPMPAGHQLMAVEWTRVVSRKLKWMT